LHEFSWTKVILGCFRQRYLEVWKFGCRYEFV